MSDLPQDSAVARQDSTPAQEQGQAAPGSAPQAESSLNPIDQIRAQDLETRVVEVLRTVYDPEIPVNIYEMGLVYGIRTTADGAVHVSMTLTSPACPVAGSLPIEVEQRIRSIDGVTSVRVDIVWEPPWSPEKMSEAAKLQLGFM